MISLRFDAICLSQAWRDNESAQRNKCLFFRTEQSEFNLLKELLTQLSLVADKQIREVFLIPGI